MIETKNFNIISEKESKISWYKYIIALRRSKTLNYRLFIKALKFLDNDYKPVLMIQMPYLIKDVKKGHKLNCA